MATRGNNLVGWRGRRCCHLKRSTSTLCMRGRRYHGHCRRVEAETCEWEPSLRAQEASQRTIDGSPGTTTSKSCPGERGEEGRPAQPHALVGEVSNGQVGVLLGQRQRARGASETVDTPGVNEIGGGGAGHQTEKCNLHVNMCTRTRGRQWCPRHLLKRASSPRPPPMF